MHLLPTPTTIKIAHTPLRFNLDAIFPSVIANFFLFINLTRPRGIHPEFMPHFAELVGFRPCTCHSELDYH
jgi:hypothetical protein